MAPRARGSAARSGNFPEHAQGGPALDVVLPELRGEAEAAQRDKRMAALRAFVDAAWPDRFIAIWKDGV